MQSELGKNNLYESDDNAVILPWYCFDCFSVSVDKACTLCFFFLILMVSLLSHASSLYSLAGPRNGE